MTKISIVNPVYTNAPTLPALFERLDAVARGNPQHYFEFVYDDDGSEDVSFQVSEEAAGGAQPDAVFHPGSRKPDVEGAVCAIWELGDLPGAQAGDSARRDGLRRRWGRMKRRTSLISVIFVLAAGFSLGLAGLGQGAKAQQGGGWSPPVNLSNSETQSNDPSLAVDPSGGVHVAWSEETEDGRAFIRYAQLSEGSWSQANDILTSPDTEVAIYPTLGADSKGYLHLVWSGDGTLYYSRAYATEAGTPQGWSPPVALEFVQDNIGQPQLLVDAQDVLHLVYAISLGSKSGIYTLTSTDGGQNWSDPVRIFNNKRSDRMVGLARLAIGSEGTMHTVWVEYDYPETFPPIGIRYSQSTDGGQTWSEAASLADGPYSFPAIITRDPDEVHLVYSGTGSDRFKFHRVSEDGGKTWAEAYRNSEVGGYQGLPALVLDSSKVLHWLTSATIFRIKNDGLYHTTWEDGPWSAGVTVLVNVANGQNPQEVAAEVGLGNELHAAVQYPLNSEAQPEGWQQEIYYVGNSLNTPQLTGTALASPTPVKPTEIASLATPSATEKPGIVNSAAPAANGMFSQAAIILGGSVLAVLLVVITVAIASRKNRGL